MKPFVWLLRLMLVAFLTSCTSSLTGYSPRNERPLKTLRPQIQAKLERREFLDALRLLQQQVRLGMTEASLAEEYGLALRGGMSYSEGLLKKRQFSECGIYTRQLLNLYPHKLSAIPGVSTEQIIERLNYCSDQLMAKGLTEYRAGQMQQAIDCWTALLVFNPECDEAKKAIKTCTIQQRNLKKKP